MQTAPESIDFIDLFNQFKTEGVIASTQSFGAGHINDTYLLRTKNPADHDYVYQRINHAIFSDVPKLMSNISYVTQHIRHKLISTGHPSPVTHCLTPLSAHNGQYFIQDAKQHYWAAYIFIPGRTFNLVPSPAHALQGGKIYGEFLNYLNDIDASRIHETIPNFHNIDHRLDQFKAALARDSLKRKNETLDLISFVATHSEQMRTILKLGISGKIPLRIVHNDTKFNNVVLDENNQGLCAIDLDTVMPGYLHYDYSDAIRTGASTGNEDEADLNKVDLDLDLFSGFCQGFIPAIRPSITDTELAFLATSTHLLPFIIGLRFLTDYINGDTYFKTHYPKQNLIRARAQFHLVKQIKKKMPAIEGIIQSIIEQSDTA